MNWSIGPGSDVVMHFAIRLEDGTEVESTAGEQAIAFTMGDGTFIRGLELALYGLRPGDKQTLKISPQEGYGFHDPNQVHTVEISKFPHGIALEKGTIVAFDVGDEQLAATILERQGESMRVDFNHPLAGHEIEFEVDIIKVGPAFEFQEQNTPP